MSVKLLTPCESQVNELKVMTPAIPQPKVKHLKSSASLGWM